MAAQNEVKLIISADGSGAIAASKQVADAYKTLGAQTVADLNAQKGQITAAYETIKTSGVASAEEIRHAEEAKNMAISRLNEDLVSKNQGWVSQIKEHWVGLAAGIGAAMLAINKGTEFVELGAKALQTESAFKGVATSVHESAETLLADWQRASAGTVTATELMQRGIKGMTQGLSGADMTKVWEMARQGAITAGMDVKTAGEEITNAIANNLPRAMVRFGLVTKEQMQLINKAMASGVEDVHMLDIAYDNYLIKQAMIGPKVDTANEALQRHRKAIEELKESIGKGLVTALGWTIEKYQTLTGLMNKAADKTVDFFLGPKQTGASGSWGEPAPPADPQEKLKKDLEGLQAAANSKGMRELREAFDAWKVSVANLNPQLLETDKRLNDINKEAQKFIQGKPGAAPGTTIAIPKSEVDKQVAIAQGYLQQEALLKNQKLNAKMEEESLKQQQQYAKEYEALFNEVAGSRVNAEQVALAKIDTEENKRIGRASELYLKDAWDYVNATRVKAMTAEQYETLLTKIHEDAERQRTALTTKNAAAREVAENQERLAQIDLQQKMLAISPAQATGSKLAENQSLLASLTRYKEGLEAAGQTGDQVYLSLLEKIRSVQKAVNELTAENKAYTGTFGEGFQKGVTEYQYSVKTAFQGGEEIAKSMTSSMEKNFMTFFDHTSKGFLNFHDLAVSLLADVEKALIKTLLVQPLVSGITGAMTGNMPSASSLGPLGSLFDSLFGGGSTAAATEANYSSSLGNIDWSLSAGESAAWGYHEGGPIQTLHEGGHAKALKPGEVPVIAMAGEYMIRKSAAEQLGPGVLNALNQGKLPGSTISVPVTVQGAKISHADIYRLRSSIEEVCYNWTKGRL